MKNKVSKLFIVRILILHSLLIINNCAPKITQHGIVSYANSNGKETIKVKVDDYGKSDKEAITNAEKLALKTLLFSGIAGSEVNTPLINLAESNNEATKDYITKLFTNDRYRIFLSCSETVQIKKEKKTFHANLNCCISYRLLRKDLEDNNIIKKFGL